MCAYFHIYGYVRVSVCVAWKVQGVVGWGWGNAVAVVDIDFVLLLIVKIIDVICLG